MFMVFKNPKFQEKCEFSFKNAQNDFEIKEILIENFEFVVFFIKVSFNPVR